MVAVFKRVRTAEVHNREGVRGKRKLRHPLQFRSAHAYRGDRCESVSAQRNFREGKKNSNNNYRPFTPRAAARDETA